MRHKREVRRLSLDAEADYRQPNAVDCPAFVAPPLSMADAVNSRGAEAGWRVHRISSHMTAVNISSI